MEFWNGLWKYIFFVSITGFAVLSLWVAVAGLRDIKRMFADLRRGQDERGNGESE